MVLNEQILLAVLEIGQLSLSFKWAKMGFLKEKKQIISLAILVVLPVNDISGWAQSEPIREQLKMFLLFFAEKLLEQPITLFSQKQKLSKQFVATAILNTFVKHFLHIWELIFV